MRRKLNRRGKAFVAFMLLLILSVFLYVGYLPVIRLTAQAEGNRLAEKTIASAVNAAASRNSIDLKSLVTVERDEDGQIKSVFADTAALNSWKEMLIEDVENSLENSTYEKKIPLGTLVGSVLLYGRGPAVPLKVTLGGYMNADVETVFDSAGINQTRYGLYLKVNFRVNTYLPLCSTAVETENRILLSEYVIMGEVPDLYTVPSMNR